MTITLYMLRSLLLKEKFFIPFEARFLLLDQVSQGYLKFALVVLIQLTKPDLLNLGDFGYSQAN